ncbi:MAG: glycosyltransferase family 39 protein [Butyrivibrio sp.]|nr:glycosyltransferase family 39 protein [Butyrivibrio sp.]
MRFFDWCFRILSGLLALVCTGLLFFGFFFTVVFRPYQENDYPDFYRIPVLPTLLVFLVTALLLLWGLRRHRDEPAGSTDRMPVLPCLLMLVWGLVFMLFLLAVIRGLPTNDAYILNGITLEFQQSDYHALADGYLVYCPHQLSYVWISELLTAVFGANRFLPYQLLNVLSILMTMFYLYRTAWVLTRDARVCTALALLSPGCLMLYVYSTFIYNDIWCLGPLFAAFYCLLRFLEHPQPGYGVAAALLAGISFFIKTNGAVALIAMGGILFVVCCRHLSARDSQGALRCILAGMLLILFAWGFQAGIKIYYEHRSGLEVQAGEPAAAYFAMGLNETDGKYGWYDGTNVRLLSEAGEDSALAAQAAVAQIRERLAQFISRPRYAVKFFGIKFLSQWGDPTKASLREQELTGRHQDRGALAEVLTYGAGYRVFQAVMQLFHLLLYFFAAIGCVQLCRRKTADPEQYLLPLFFFGGLLFHELWEASGRYTLRYELAMLPVAAMGMVWLADLLPPGKWRMHP